MVRLCTGLALTWHVALSLEWQRVASDRVPKAQQRVAALSPAGQARHRREGGRSALVLEQHAEGCRRPEAPPRLGLVSAELLHVEVDGSL